MNLSYAGKRTSIHSSNYQQLSTSRILRSHNDKSDDDLEVLEERAHEDSSGSSPVVVSNYKPSVAVSSLQDVDPPTESGNNLNSHRNRRDRNLDEHSDSSNSPTIPREGFGDLEIDTDKAIPDFHQSSEHPTSKQQLKSALPIGSISGHCPKEFRQKKLNYHKIREEVTSQEELLINYLIEELLPPTEFESTFLYRMVNKTHLSPEIIKQKCSLFYLQKKKEIIQQLKNVNKEYSVSLRVLKMKDERNLDFPIIFITVHFIDEYMEYHEVDVDLICDPMNEIKNLADAIHKSLVKYNLLVQPFAITVDKSQFADVKSSHFVTALSAAYQEKDSLLYLIYSFRGLMERMEQKFYQEVEHFMYQPTILYRQILDSNAANGGWEDEKLYPSPDDSVFNIIGKMMLAQEKTNFHKMVDWKTIKKIYKLAFILNVNKDLKINLYAKALLSLNQYVKLEISKAQKFSDMDVFSPFLNAVKSETPKLNLPLAVYAASWFDPRQYTHTMEEYLPTKKMKDIKMDIETIVRQFNHSSVIDLVSSSESDCDTDTDAYTKVVGVGSEKIELESGEYMNTDPCLPMTNLKDIEPVLKFWKSHIGKPNYENEFARAVFAIPASIKETDAFDKVIKKRWTKIDFEWLRTLVMIKRWGGYKDTFFEL